MSFMKPLNQRSGRKTPRLLLLEKGRPPHRPAAAPAPRPASCRARAIVAQPPALHATRWFALRAVLGGLAFIVAGAPTPLPAEFSETKMGEYLHYAVAAANGGVYAGI